MGGGVGVELIRGRGEGGVAIVRERRSVVTSAAREDSSRSLVTMA